MPGTKSEGVPTLNRHPENALYGRVSAAVALLALMWCCQQAIAADGILPELREAADPVSNAALMPFGGDFRVPADADLPAETVYFNNEFGTKLRGWYFPAEGSQQTVLFCMGNTGNVSIMLPYAKILHEGGFDVLLFDYQGFGASEGLASVFSLPGDVRSAFDFVVTKTGRPAQQIGVFGVSLGSVLAMAVAADRQAGAAAVEDVFLPTEMMDTMLDQHLNAGATAKAMLKTMSGALLAQVDPLVTAKRLQGPLFLIHGVHDRLLPPSGTLRVAEAASGPTRVWMMQNTGHAPESLEVNEAEYAAQLQTFFRDAFAGELRDPAVRYVAEPDGGEHVVKATITPAVGDTGAHAVQLVVSDRHGQFHFHRCECPEEETFALKVPFVPTDVSVIRILCCEPDPTECWTPALTDYSRALHDYRQLAAQVFGNEERSELAVQWQGHGFSMFRGKFPPGITRELLMQVPVPAEIPQRIRPRYARLLARLECWPGVKHAESDHELPFAEAMLQYFPADPDDYYELGNARIDLGFRDVIVARALYRLAELRLRKGRVDEARELLRQHIQILPEWYPTTLTEEQISGITNLEDLRGRQR